MFLTNFIRIRMRIQNTGKKVPVVLNALLFRFPTEEEVAAEVRIPGGE
jgi:hypothetical protein